MVTKFSIKENVFIVDNECMFCTNSFDHCDFLCEKNNCLVIKNYLIIKILIDEFDIFYYGKDEHNNIFKFSENSENVFIHESDAKNYQNDNKL